MEHFAPLSASELCSTMHLCWDSLPLKAAELTELAWVGANGITSCNGSFLLKCRLSALAPAMESCLAQRLGILLPQSSLWGPY